MINKIHSSNPSRWSVLPLLAVAVGLCSCTNNPYPEEDARSPILYTTLGEDPKTLDPAVAYTVSDGEVLMGVCDTFLEYNYLKRDPLVLVPSMGARMPDRKPYTFTEQAPQKDKKGDPIKDAKGHPVTKPTVRHGEIWTFTLKPGIRFSDDSCFSGGKGREATAADFVYSFKRLADPTVNCPILNYLLPHVVGLQEFNDAESDKQKTQGKKYRCDLNQSVSGVQVDAHDPYTFHITLRDQYPQLRYLMAMAFTAPVAHEAVDYYTGGARDEFRKHPVGTGPYRLVEWTEKRRLVLERNPYYHTDVYPSQGMPGDREKGLLADAGQPLPLTPKIVYTIIKESIPGWNLFQQGYLDSYGVVRESYEKVITRQGTLSADMQSKGISLDTAVGMDVNYFCFNMEDPVVGGYTPEKRKLREALSQVFDTSEYLELLANGRGIHAQGALPPGIFGYDPSYKNPFRQPNLTRARQLLAEAGYPDGIDPATHHPLELFYDNSSTTAAGRWAVGLVIRQLEQLGIKVNERGMPYSVFQDKVNNGQYQFTSWGWVADYPDPENFYLLFYSTNKGPGPNTSRYSNPVFDKLYEKMAAMDDGPERLKIIQQMRGIIQEDCPWIFNSHSEEMILNYDWVHNAKAHPVALNTMKYIRIDGKLRSSKRAEWNHPRYDVVGAVLALFLLSAVPAIMTVRRRREMSAKAHSRTLISQGTTGGPVI